MQGIVITTKNDPMLARLRCKQWDCKYCVSKNRRAWRKAIYDYLEQNPDLKWSFHTFTMPKWIHNAGDVTAGAELIKKYWQRLMQRLQRKYGKFSYIRVIEMHKSGIPHIHMMASFVIPDADLSKHKDPKKQYIKWLKRAIGTKELPFGYMVNNQNAIGKSAQITQYITAYMTTETGDFLDIMKLNRLRIVLTTRDIKSPFAQKENDLEWKMRVQISKSDIMLRGEFLDLNKKRKIGLDDLTDDGFYPDTKEYVD